MIGRSCIVGLLAVMAIAPYCAAEGLPPAQWHGRGAYRLWLEVPARDIGERATDEALARAEVDFGALLASHAIAGVVSPTSIEMVQYDPETLLPVPYTGYSSDGRGLVPCRFDNANLRSYSYMYNMVSDAQRGELAWAHRQMGEEPGLYALYFDVGRELPHGIAAARPLIGDFDVLYRREGGPLSSMYHTRVAVGDWNGDGLFDLLVGNILGHVFFHENVGVPGEPRFGAGRMLEAMGEPLDVGWYAAPDLVDWDGDGDLDLIVGADGGKVLLFENTGSPSGPQLAAGEPVTAEGAPIITPAAPCPETPFMTRDYVPVPAAVDWDGDGDLDLLVGGYLTGWVFYYENVRNSPGKPVLEARGPLTADGEPIDTLWQAAPCPVDLDGDGDLDLVCGTMDQRVHESQTTPWPSFFYYENVGTREAPRLRRGVFPLDEAQGDLTNPRAVDWDDDGDWDLVTGIGHEVRLMRNTGTRQAPRFSGEPPLTAPWTPLLGGGFATPPVDWDGDGDWDLLRSGGRTATYLENVEPGNPPRYEERGELAANGEVILHEFLPGDDHTFGEFFDWDNDGDLDYLLGNSAGEVWIYRNIGSPSRPLLASGERLALADGRPLLVGMPIDTPVTDFATHSGNRSDPAAADYDGDGNHDLVVADAYGKLTLFRNTGTNEQPRFAEGEVLLTGEGRAFVCAADWNRDGPTDLIVSWAEGVWYCENIGTKTEPKFERTRRFDPPWIPYPHPYVVDWNQDGDLDLFLASSYTYCFVADRSYLDHGYAEGGFLGMEKRPAPVSE